jgi:ABC-type bacteriocin/lantibiotic exporter with double-glycine peptidase domain
MTVLNPLVLYALVQRLGNQLSFGDFVAFNAAYTLFFVLLLKMAAEWGDIVRILPLWKKARQIFTAKIEQESAQSDPGELTGDIVIKHIVFRYQAFDQPLFKDLSLAIKPGEFIAIVGPSGSGKSTLFRLMLGFEEAEAGEIYYNGINLRTLKLSALRKQVGVVIQNSTLIPGTIFANIAGNSAKMTRSEAWEIADKVGLADFIKYLPMQMDTLISEGPITLSGGEAQRLILARALAQKPKILILDEATSALDNTTQAVVHNYLKQLQATQIIAAHRLSTIVNADRILVLEKGAIVQTGSFTDLISQPGLFAQMAKRQF